MRIYDISVTISPEIVTWGNSDPGIVRKWSMRIDQGDACNVSTVTIGSHCGTHLDAPLHFIGGGGTVENLELDDLIGPCRVIEFGDLAQPDITVADLEAASIAPGAKRVLFKTSNSRRGLMRDPNFHTDFVAISPDAARWLVARGVRTIGVDYLSVGAAEGANGKETHEILLGAKLVLLEGLLLEDVPAGSYNLVALPLKIAGAEGCPIRAVLLADR
jgi:arylformamidase